MVFSGLDNFQHCRSPAQSDRRLPQRHEPVMRLYPITRLHIHFGNAPRVLGHKLHGHLHGLNGQRWITFGHVLVYLRLSAPCQARWSVRGRSARGAITHERLVPQCANPHCGKLSVRD
jgi:hypothetical protein